MERTSNLLGALALTLTDRMRADLKDASNLSVTEAAALNTIGHSPGLSIKAVSQVLEMTHPGTVRIIDRLSAAGLVERLPGVDGRTVGLAQTQDGRRVWHRQLRVRQRSLDELIAGLDPRTRDLVTRVVEPLLAAMTTDAVEAERICRLCNESVCPQDVCPVTCAVRP